MNNHFGQSIPHHGILQLTIYQFLLYKIDEIDLCNMKWPIIPINRHKVQEMYSQDDYIKINQSIKKAEQFWVNNDFQSSTNQIIIFLKTIQDGNDKI